eukprot:TRINITY_DN15791_c0_g1_i2.p1 TRINITY_DN15791_c0_g1~~TRINITY_DN15791_c0_g1_i2.p1  ORF type:complete len:283 (-),score=27.84 TRINITY_DN15791_c0_g1_i2:30-815(-)
MQVLVPFIVQHATLHDGPVGQAHLVVLQQLGDQQKNAQSAGTAGVVSNMENLADVIAIEAAPPCLQVDRGVDTRSGISASSASGSASRASSSESEGSGPDVKAVNSLSLEIVDQITHIGIKSYSVRFGAQTGSDTNDVTTWPDLRGGVPHAHRWALEQWMEESITRSFDGEEARVLLPGFTFDLPLLGQIVPGQMTCHVVGGSLDDSDVPIRMMINIADPKVCTQIKLKEEQKRNQTEEKLRKALARSTRMREHHTFPASL